MAASVTRELPRCGKLAAQWQWGDRTVELRRHLPAGLHQAGRGEGPGQHRGGGPGVLYHGGVGDDVLRR